jgi:hypothetical protein
MTALSWVKRAADRMWADDREMLAQNQPNCCAQNSKDNYRRNNQAQLAMGA